MVAMPKRHKAHVVYVVANEQSPLLDALAKLISDEAENVSPDFIAQMLSARNRLVHGQPVTLVPLPEYLVPSEAASLLNVPVAYLQTLVSNNSLRLIDLEGELVFPTEDIVRFKRRRDRDRQALLADITQVSQDLGFYGASVDIDTDPQ